MSSLGKSLLDEVVAAAVLVTVAVAVTSDGVAHRIVVLLLIATAATKARASQGSPAWVPEKVLPSALCGTRPRGAASGRTTRTD